MKEESRLQYKRIAPAALHALKEALTSVFWYKQDLKNFLILSLYDVRIVSLLNWDDHKRNIVSQLIEYLVRKEDKHQRQLLQLMIDVVKMTDFSHLERLDDGRNKATRAREDVNVLRAQIGALERAFDDVRESERRRDEARKNQMATTAVREKLEELRDKYCVLISSADLQARGYRLEEILRELFELFDLDPRASFRIAGEQIDGAFSFEGTDYLIEAKWQQALVGASDLDSLHGKLGRKLENTLGLFVSVNGYSQDGVDVCSSGGRKLIILMDGSDLMAVLEARIDLPQLLLRKRREAAQTGNIYLRIHEILT
jgi:hypothetical protein